MKERPVRFTDSQVAHILKRAAEIDAQGDSMSAEELRGIAAEAGIDPRATDAAIRELLAEEEGGSLMSPPRTSPVTEGDAELPARKMTPPSPWRIASGGAVGMACGFIYGWSIGLSVYPVTANALIGLGTATLYLVTRGLQCRKRGNHLDFQLENLAVWCTAALGPMIAWGWHMGSILAPLFVAWFLVAVIGGLLMRLGSKEESATEEPPRIEAGAG